MAVCFGAARSSATGTFSDSISNAASACHSPVLIYIILYYRSLNIEELCIASTKVPPFFGTVGSTIATDLMSMLPSLSGKKKHLLLTYRLLVFCFPFPLLRTINLPRRKLVGLTFAFMLGFLTIFAAVCRVIAISISATVSTVTAWSALECSTGIMVACIPALNVLVSRRKSSNRIKPYPRHVGPSILSAADRNEIWDGTDATAPQWIRMASISGPGGSDAMSPSTAKFDDLVDSALSEQLTRSQKSYPGCGSGDFSMVTAVPNIRLKIGRGIVEHAYMPPASPTPTHHHPGVGNSLLSPSSMDGSGANFRSNESDDTLPWVLTRCDTGESGKRIVGSPKSVSLSKCGKSEFS